MKFRQHNAFTAARGRDHAWRIVAVVCIAWILGVASAYAAAPVVDTLYGTNGVARIGGASGAEDAAQVAVRQPDGKIIIAGRSNGRVTYNYAVRLTTAGQLDSTFGQGGVALLDPALVLGSVWQIAVRGDGALLIGGFDGTGWFIVRLTGSGAVDPTFGTNGVFRSGASSLDSVWFVQQPDARLLLVTGVYQQPTLRITRLDTNGTLDTAFGERTVTAPAEHSLGGLPLAEDGQGGFVAVMIGTVRLPDGTVYLTSTAPFALMRVTADGTLAAGFGTGGIVRSADLGITFGLVRSVVRGANGAWFVATTSTTDVQVSGTPLLIRLDDNGTPDGTFGTGGRFQIPTGILLTSSVRMVPLVEGGALIAGTASFNQAQLMKIGAAGTLDMSYGQSGVATIEPAGYQGQLGLAAGFTEPGGAVKLVTSLAQVLRCTTICLSSGLDAGVIAVTASGQLATGYGRGDGVAVYDRAESSTDTIDSLYLLPSGAAVLAGGSSANGVFKLLVARMTSDGKPDGTFGTAGRALADAFGRCLGPLQLAAQPDGAVVVAVAAAAGSLCNVGAGASFRLDASGTAIAFSSVFASTDIGNATDALVARPDGRLVHATVNTNFSAHVAIIDQALPDGTPDPQFGVNGRVTLDIPSGGSSRNVTLALLPDGTLIAATVTAYGLALFKLDAVGKPVAGFGSGGVVFVPGEFSAATGFGRAVGIAVLEDTSLYVQFDATHSAGGGGVKALRLSASGAIRSTLDLPAGTSRATFVALADNSIVIAGTGSASTPVLRRLLPNDTFDPAFGPGGVFSVPGATGIAALALDIEGRLIVGGADATSSLLMRLLMTSVVAPATVVEFHHAALDHYFVTANPLEAAAVDNGAAGPGWARTGLTFRSGGANKVCRFYGNLAPNPATGLPFGPNSHFYTATPSECAFLLAIFKTTEKSWHFESYDFSTTAPVLLFGAPDESATCPAGTLPVYRAYNRGFERGEDSNHRLTNNLAAYQATVARGWAGEGIRMCAPPDVTTQ